MIKKFGDLWFKTSKEKFSISFTLCIYFAVEAATLDHMVTRVVFLLIALFFADWVFDSLRELLARKERIK